MTKNLRASRESAVGTAGSDRVDVAHCADFAGEKSFSWLRVVDSHEEGTKVEIRYVSTHGAFVACWAELFLSCSDGLPLRTGRG